MAKALDVATYFLSLADETAGDLISNLKLNKLLYYAQGFHLARFDEALFEEPIEAWTHGPVVPAVYHVFKAYGSGPIPIPSGAEIVLDEQTREHLNEIYNVFGQFSAWKLRNMTHDEPPWADTRTGEVISHEALRDYFKTQLV